MSDQKLAVIANAFYGNPLVEASLGWRLLAQVPLANVTSTVTIADQLGQRGQASIQSESIIRAAGSVRPKPGHQRRARGRTHRLGNVSPVKNNALGREFI